jgi:cytochrome c1
MLLALSTGHKIGLALTAVAFIAFALVSAVVVPRGRPDFPGRALPAFLVATVGLFVAMLGAVEIFGAEPKEAAKPEHGQPAVANPAAVATGKQLAASLGCTGCHSVDGTPGAGPTWKALAGSQVKLADGTTVTADDAYLAESIRDPDKQIVASFKPGVMSSVIKPGSVSQADAQALVAYVDSLK